MKLLLITLLSAVFLLSCNNNIYKNSITKISSVKVYYQNGDSLKGQLNYPIYFNEIEIYLKLNNKKNKKIKTTEIEKVIYSMPNDQKVIFKKFLINDETISTTKDKFQFLELLSEGKINLYYGHNFGFLYKDGKNKKFLQKTNLFYCKRGNETNLTLIHATTNKSNSNENNALLAKDYFQNEPSIKDKINSTNFTQEYLITLIKNFNK